MGKGARIALLGVRGTVPVDGPEVARYGGATTCVLVRMGGEVIVLDAGSGMMRLNSYLKSEEQSVHLLLSHPHLDHMLGLPSCPVLYDSTRQIHIYAAAHSGLSPREQVARMMEPPLWPVGPEVFQADVSFQTLTGPFALGDVAIETLEGVHPGGCTAFRLEHSGMSIVYATDYELDDQSIPRLADFARGCSLLLCDGQYSDTEFLERRGYGHSSWRGAATLARESGAQRLLVLHHAPWRTDAALDAAQPLLERIFSNGAFARGGEEITL